MWQFREAWQVQIDFWTLSNCFFHNHNRIVMILWVRVSASLAKLSINIDLCRSFDTFVIPISDML